MKTKIIVLVIVSVMTFAPVPVSKSTEYVQVEEPKPVMIEVRKTVPPLMEKIAKCESGGTQFKADGEIVVGLLTDPRLGQDLGKWQINTKYHGARAKELGIDLTTEYGNEKYAMLLYEEQGTSPWLASARCWK